MRNSPDVGKVAPVESDFLSLPLWSLSQRPDVLILYSAQDLIPNGLSHKQESASNRRVEDHGTRRISRPQTVRKSVHKPRATNFRTGLNVKLLNRSPSARMCKEQSAVSTRRDAIAADWPTNGSVS